MHKKNYNKQTNLEQPNSRTRLEYTGMPLYIQFSF